ncbi:BTAD domain-containing putative transcriptional regulator [Micromonospora sp. DT233]|uniref:BTAD domain-containing putative transcriptional regulator n=1 Tax=Micromonospora sp. DT233 TaxID=3393432 RepID=UPI003CEAB643
MSTLRFEILGPQRVRHAEQEIDTGPGKQRAVLAVLLLSVGRPVPTGQIIEAVWPEESPANGPNVVQKYVAGLRRVLEPERSPRTPSQVLTLSEAGYLLRVPPDAVDAIQFERSVRRAQQLRAEGREAEAVIELRAATELWRGEPLAGLPGPFFDSARYRLVELRATALETRVELELQLGRYRELAGELAEMVAEFPLRERLRHQLMLALYRSGRQAEALAAYREIGELLRDEYGIEPGNALQELHRRILRSDPSLGASGPPAVVPPPAAGAPPSVSPVAVPPVSAPGPVTSAPPAPGPVTSAPPAAPGPGGAAWPPASPPPAVASAVPALPYVSPVPGVPASGALWRAPRWLSVTSTVVGVAVTLLSLGALTWVITLAYAAWRRSWRLAVASLGYLGLVVSFFYIAISTEGEPGDGGVLYFLAVLAVCWCGGLLHVVLLNRELQTLLGRSFGRRSRANEDDRRARREQARHLLHHHPAARHELGVGRPDLPRVFDDGGLVDINAVTDQVLAALPGLTPDQCRHIIAERALRGPYSSVEELAGRCLLPPTVTDHLRDILLFLPPGLPHRDRSAAPNAW